jgi:hypothetical protein
MLKTQQKCYHTQQKCYHKFREISELINKRFSKRIEMPLKG